MKSFVFWFKPQDLSAATRRRRVLLVGVLVLLLCFVGVLRASAVPPDKNLLPPAPTSYSDTPIWDQYSVWSYMWDGDYTLKQKISGLPIFNFLFSSLFMLGALIVKLTIYMLHWSFSNGIVSTLANSVLTPLLGSLQNSIFAKYVFLPLAMTGIAALYWSWKGEKARATGGVAQTLVVLLVAYIGFGQLPTLLTYFDMGVTDMSTVVMAATSSLTTNLPNDPNADTSALALRQTSNQLWMNLVVQPWCIGEFGDMQTCWKYQHNGMPGGEVLGQPNDDVRAKFLKNLPDADKQMFGSAGVAARMVLFLMLAPVCLLQAGLFLFLALTLIGYAIWIVVQASLFPFYVTTAAFPEKSHRLASWALSLASSVFMKLGVAVVIGLVSAITAIVWGTWSNWVLALLINMVVAAAAIIFRSQIVGSVLGVFDGARGAMGMPQGGGHVPGVLGGRSADGFRGAIGAMVAGGLIGAGGALARAPGRIARRVSDQRWQNMAQESLMRRYTHDKMKAEQTPGGEFSDFVKQAEGNRSQGLSMFTSEQLGQEAERLRALRKSGQDPRRALLRPGDDPTSGGYAHRQASFTHRVEQEKAAVKEAKLRGAAQLPRAVQGNTGLARTANRVASSRPVQAVVKTVAQSRAAKAATTFKGQIGSAIATTGQRLGVGKLAERFRPKPARTPAWKGIPEQAEIAAPSSPASVVTQPMPRPERPQVQPPMETRNRTPVWGGEQDPLPPKPGEGRVAIWQQEAHKEQSAPSASPNPSRGPTAVVTPQTPATTQQTQAPTQTSPSGATRVAVWQRGTESQPPISPAPLAAPPAKSDSDSGGGETP